MAIAASGVILLYFEEEPARRRSHIMERAVTTAVFPRSDPLEVREFFLRACVGLLLVTV